MRYFRTRHRWLTAGLALFLLLSLIVRPPPAHAAAFVVNSQSDAADAQVGNGLCRTSAGKCTLRAAIQETNALPGADTIQVPAGTFTLAIAPLNDNLANTGDYDVTGPLTIVGAGAGSTILDAGAPPAGSPPERRGLDRLFEIHPAAGNVTISKLTLREGYSAESGGAIHYAAPGILRLENVRVLDSYAAKYGGGIHNAGHGWVELVGATLSGNGAVEGGSAINNAAAGTVAILADSKVSNNPGTYPLGAGAIHNQAEADAIGTISIADSTVAGNAATHDGAAIHNARDGSIVVTRSTITGNTTQGDGGGIYTASGAVSVADSTISGNGAQEGGGIYNAGVLTKAGLRSQVGVAGSIVSGNTAQGSGGGIFNDLEGQLALTGVTVSNNTAGAEGGGVSSQGKASLTITGGAFAGNVAADQGGGLAVESEQATSIDGTVFSGNSAGAAGGGGLYADGPGALDITAATFEGNSAGGNGGGLGIHSFGIVTLDDTIVRDNVSQENGGGVENSAMQVTFTRLSVTDNTATLDGGGIHNTSSGEFTMLDTTVEGNAAANGGGLANRSDSTLVVRGSLFSANSARLGGPDSGQGGGIYSISDGDALIENSTFAGNNAQTAGGGIYHDADAELRIVNATIWGNAAPVGGGMGVLESDSIPTIPPTPNASVILRNTIVAGGPQGGSCDGAVSSEGGNIDGGTGCYFQGLHDRTNANLALGALADNGGPTLTHALAATSPAVDGGVVPCPATDQRGIMRPQNDGCDSGAVEFVGTPAPPDTGPPVDGYVPGEVLVKLQNPADLAGVAQDFGLSPAPLDQFGTRPIYRMAIGDGAQPPDKAAALAADSRVANAEPNYTGQTPEGRERSSWAGGGDAGEYAGQWAPDVIRLPEAHTVTRGAGVTVAVLDTGVDSSHPELVGRVGPGYDFVNMDADPHEEGSAADPAYGHGTHAAGLVALTAPEATIMPVRMLEPDGTGNLWVAIEALQFAVNPDGNPQTSADSADVINMSFSFLRQSDLLNQFVHEVTCDDDDQESGENLCDATGGRGVVFVAAAGNSSSSTPEYPAAEQVGGLLAVAASTEADTLADFSNRGPWVHVAAPGEYIISSVPDDGYATWSGTSMAAPLAAGTAALVRAREPGLNASAVASQVINAAADIGDAVPRRLDTAVALGLPRSLGAVQCQGTIGAVPVDSVTVPPGATCTLNRTRIAGTVKVEPGASLSASGVSVGGNIEGQGAAMVAVLSGAVVEGAIQVKEGTTATIDGSRVDGGVQLEKNGGTLLIAGSIIGGSLQVKENTGGVTITSNTIGGNLQCEQNNPAPTGGGNSAGSKEGQCAAL